MKDLFQKRKESICCGLLERWTRAHKGIGKKENKDRQLQIAPMDGSCPQKNNESGLRSKDMGLNDYHSIRFT